MKIKQITENTTAGSIATVETSLGGTQSRGNPSIYGGKKVGSLFKGKKTKAPYANSINESAELSEAQLEEDDVIVVPGQGRSRKNGLVPHGQSRVDHEVEMARSDLFSAAKNAQQVYSMIKDLSEEEGLDGWVQEKIIKANDYLNTIREYLEGKQVQGVSEGEDGVDSLVTDTEAIMDKFKIDALQALKIVLGEREYKDRPGFYNSFIRKIIARSKQQGLAEGYDPVESDYQQWEDILVKDGYRGDPSGAYALKLVVGHQLMLDPAEVASTIRNILTYVKQNRQVLGKAVSDRTTVKDAIIDIKNKFPQQYQAAQQPQGVAEGSRNAYLKHNNLVDIEKPLAGLKSEFEKFLQTHDPKEKQKYQQGIKQRIKSDPMSGPKGVLPEQDLAEGAKVDRMVKHVAQSEKKLGKSKDEAENIAWATANKRGMLNNKNKKA
jgi:hypothetical protein